MPLIFDLAQGIEKSRNWSLSDWLAKLKAIILGSSIGAVIDSVGDRLDGDMVYYHATTLANAILIMTSQTIIGKKWEGFYVFAWKFIPDKKALKKSGAKSAEVIVAFSTFAAFEPDWGIDDPYVLQFQPVCTVYPGAVHANKVVILPII